MVNGGDNQEFGLPVCFPVADESEHAMKAAMIMRRYSPASPSSNKQVRFGQDPPDVILSNAFLEEEEIRDLWWNRGDLESFFQTAKGIAKQVRQHSRITAGLDEGYKRIQKIVEKLDDEESTLKAMETKSLDPGITQWCVYGHSRRGLERYGSMLRSENRRISELSLKIIRDFPCSADDGDAMRNEIEKQTRTSRIFARMIGLADQVAATREDTYLRRWSDLGSRPVQHLEGEYNLRPPYHRSGSL